MLKTPEEAHDEIAAEIHVLIENRLSELYGISPSLQQIADVAARTFGDACGLLVMSGAQAETFLTLNATAEQSAMKMRRDLTQATCEGNA